MRPCAVLLLAIASGCASGPVTSATEPLRAEPLEVVVTAIEGPLPSDAAPAVALTVRRGAVEHRLPGHYLGALPFDGAVVALDTAGSLRRFVVGDGDDALQSDLIAAHVTSLPVVSPDGAHLAYVVSDDGLTGALRVLDAMGDRTVTAPLGSIGALSFSPDGARVAFVGVAAVGGIAGVWIADARGIEPARCLTNCALAPGDREHVTPLPADALRVEHQRITWTDAEGLEHEVVR
jgi:hypothetical protein